MIALPWKKLCANFILPCGENHYGFFLRCPTSFYNRPLVFTHKNSPFSLKISAKLRCQPKIGVLNAAQSFFRVSANPDTSTCSRFSRTASQIFSLVIFHFVANNQFEGDSSKNLESIFRCESLAGSHLRGGQLAAKSSSRPPLQTDAFLVDFARLSGCVIFPQTQHRRGR